MPTFTTSPAGRPGHVSMMQSGPRGGGLLGRLGGRAGIGDMLLGGGLGLLSQGPSLTPQSPFAGMGQGLMMGQQMTQQRRRNAMDEMRMDMERQKFEASQGDAQLAAQQAQAKQQATVDALIAQGVPPEQAINLEASGHAGAYLSPQGPEALKPVFDPATGQTTYQPASGAVGGQVPPRAPLVQNIVGQQSAGVTDRIPSEEEAVGLWIPPDKRGDYLINTKGQARIKPERPEAAQARAKEAVGRKLSGLLEKYQGLASPMGLWGVDQLTADQTRRQIAQELARLKQPSGILTEGDIELEMNNIPELGGPLDGPRAEALINNLRDDIGIGRAPTTTPLPGSKGTAADQFSGMDAAALGAVDLDSLSPADLKAWSKAAGL